MGTLFLAILMIISGTIMYFDYKKTRTLDGFLTIMYCTLVITLILGCAISALMMRGMLK